MPLVQTVANALTNASLAGTAFTAPTGPMKVALTTTTGTSTAAGTEVTGGSYVRATFALTAATGSTAASNSGILNYASMPACTITGVDVYDSVPTRYWTGALTTSRVINAGDTVSIAVAALSMQIV